MSAIVYLLGLILVIVIAVLVLSVRGLRSPQSHNILFDDGDPLVILLLLIAVFALGAFLAYALFGALPAS